jgi:hypothetical protein
MGKSLNNGKRYWFIFEGETVVWGTMLPNPEEKQQTVLGELRQFGLKFLSAA